MNFGHVSLSAGVIAFVYFVTLTGFRFFSCETTTLKDSFFDGVYAIALLAVCIASREREEGHLHTVLCLAAYVLARLQYKKHVVGKKFKRVDLSDKVIIVTGSNAGIGFETAKQLVKMGGTVIMACRSVGKANEAKKTIVKETKCNPEKLIVLELDLCEFPSVLRFVEAFVNLKLPLHVLVNNAGVMMQERSVTKSGLETVFTANHLSHFLLTNLLLPLIEKTNGRIVNVSSSTHHIVEKFNFDDIMSEKHYELFSTYAQSKLANILFTRELQKRLTAKNSKVKCFSLHPGLVRTEVTRNMSAFLQIGNRLATPIMMTLQKTPEEGAYCSLHVATAPELDSFAGGEYFIHGEPAPVSKGAQSDADATRLWEVSEQLTGLKGKK